MTKKVKEVKKVKKVKKLVDKMLKGLSYDVWEIFRSKKDGTKVSIEKKGDYVGFFFKDKGKKHLLWSFRDAPPGKGIMDWDDYQQRTNQM